MTPLRIFIGDIEDRISPEPMSGCWLWTGSSSKTGYGDVRIKGRHVSIHRLMYERAHGSIGSGLHVLHKCDVRACCNPDHLFIGTNSDNIADSMSKGRRKGITRKRPSGLSYHYTRRPGPPNKLSSDQTQSMRAEYLAGGVSKSALARKYGVSSASVCRKPTGYLAGL